MKVYIAGPMTGLPEFNYPAFNEAAAVLCSAGFSPVNPADEGIDPNRSWLDYMKAGLRQLLDCEGVAALPGWEDSKGATLEVVVAHRLNMRLGSVADWLAWVPR